jgi:sterol desaturase/sphingolipid hydroxylase (fatty acid hydroxylase superfamily)
MDAISQLVAALFDAVGLNKAEFKDALFSVGLGPVWEALRTSLLYPLAIASAVTCLVLERIIHVYRRDRAVTASMVLDYVYPLLNAATFVATVEAALVGVIASLHDRYLPFLKLDLLSGLSPVAQGIGVFLVIDFVFYVSHYLHHKVPLFWYLHAVHHSQEDLNPLTTYRGHPLEGVTKSVIRTAPLMIFGGTPATVFWFVWLNSFWGFFIHSNIRTNLGFLKYVLVTPQYHRVHHSIERRHFDKNYGERLTLWDWLFGTMWPHFDDYPATGVLGFPVPKESDARPLGLIKSWWSLTIYPFHRMLRPSHAHQEPPEMVV